MPQRSRSTGPASTRAKRGAPARPRRRWGDDPLPVSTVSSSPAARVLHPRSRSVAEAAPEGIVPAVSAPTGIARAETRLRPIGVIGARHIIIASTVTTAAATARSGCIGSPTATAARSRRDDDGADRDWIGGWNENGAAAAVPTDATPGIGIIGGGKVQADRERQHGGRDSTQLSSWDSTTANSPPGLGSPAEGHPKLRPASIGRVNMSGLAVGRSRPFVRQRSR